MAKVKIQGNASGTGVITLIAPNTNTDRTVTLPDESITLSAGTTAINGLSDATTSGSNNLGLGTSVLSSQTGSYNIGIGKNVLTSTSGAHGCAVGYDALRDNTSGSDNTAFGNYALGDNTTASSNAGFGYDALRLNTTGTNNTAVGHSALRSNTTTSNSVAVGWKALRDSTAVGNVGIGYYTGGVGSGGYNTGVGYDANSGCTTGQKCASFGVNANPSSTSASHEMTLGSTTISNLRCNDTSISSLSDQRDKAEITDLPDSAGLDLINSLRPVTYYWDRREWYEDGVTDGSKIKREYRSWKSNSGLRQGFIAQEVESAISGHKYLEDSQVVNGTVDKKEFAPAHLLTNAIKAIQQLSAEVETLKAEVATLKGV